MPTNKDPMLKQAALWYVANPNMQLHQTMRAAGYSDVDARNLALQQKVRRTPEYRQRNARPPPLCAVASVAVTTTINTTISSTVTMPSCDDSSRPKVEIKRTRKLPHQVQTHRNNKRILRELAKDDHKAATAMYDRE